MHLRTYQIFQMISLFKADLECKMRPAGAAITTIAVDFAELGAGEQG